MNVEVYESGTGHGRLTGSCIMVGSDHRPRLRADSLTAIVMAWPCGVHAKRGLRARHPQPDTPLFAPPQSCGITCAQTAIIATNSVIDASAAASSTNIR